MSTWLELVRDGVIVCPAPDHGRLTPASDAESLTCGACGRVFPVKDSIPVLLLSDAVDPERTG